MGKFKIGDRVKPNLSESLKVGLVNQLTKAEDPTTGIIVEVLWENEKTEWINEKCLITA